MVGLCVRRVNPRRASTQTWRFTVDGRLQCAHSNMTVQPLDGFFGLREGMYKCNTFLIIMNIVVKFIIFIASQEIEPCWVYLELRVHMY